MQRLLEVHYNFAPNKEHPAGVSFGFYIIGEYCETRSLDGRQIQLAKCEKIERFSEGDRYGVRAYFDNGVIEEQSNINKIIYTNEA